MGGRARPNRASNGALGGAWSNADGGRGGGGDTTNETREDRLIRKQYEQMIQ